MALTNGSAMRVVFVYGKERLQMDIAASQTVRQVINNVRQAFSLSSDERSIGSQSHERKILSLSFAGSTLDESWTLVDIGIPPGSQLRVFFRQETKPSLLVYTRFSGRTVEVFQPIDLRSCSGRDLRSIVSRLLGLPVGAFRLTTAAGLELYDCQTLDSYGLELGCVVYLDVWDCWTDLLTAAIAGHTDAQAVQDKLTALADDAVSLFQLRVCLYIAAHYGHVDLAVSLIRCGLVRCDEPVGEHPVRAWTNRQARHVDSYKTAIHEAAENAQLALLRYFVLQDVGSVLARDGNNLTPLNVALRRKHTACAQFLLTKQWSQIPYTKNSAISLSTYVRMKRWAEQSRDHVFRRHGASKSSIRQTTQRRNFLPTESTLLGHGVQLDGFTPSMMTSQPTSEYRQKKLKESMSIKTQCRSTTVDPEIYFRTIHVINSLQKNSLTTVAIDQQHVAKRNGHNDVVTADEVIVKSSGGEVALATNSVQRSRWPRLTQQQTGSTNHSDEPDSRHSDVTSPASLRSIEAFLLDTSAKTDDVFNNDDNSHKLCEPEVVVSTHSRVTSHKQDLNSPRNTARLTLPSVTKATPASASFSGNRHDEPLLSTRRVFERERGLKSRDYATRCLSLAHRFHERPWLMQVQQAVTIATVGVKRVYNNERHLFSDITTPRQA